MSGKKNIKTNPGAPSISSAASGMGIKVDTTAVRTAVDTLSKINQNIDKDFSPVQSSINKLSGTWNGTAARKAIDKFNNIKRNFVGPSGERRRVMDSYIKFLSDAVALDYETTESANTKLSEMFK